MSKLKTSEDGSPARERLACKNKDNIDISMERQPSGATSWTVRCLGCARQCDYNFFSQERLSFAFVDKLVGVFFSPCRYFAKKAAEAEQKKPDGQCSLMSNADE